MKKSVAIKRGPSKEEIVAFGQALAKLPQCNNLVTRDHFADGMYCRELERKAGTLIKGKVHKKEHFYIVIKGHINVVTDDGVIEMKAPYILVSQPGTQRVTYAVEDSIAITVHRVSSYNEEEMEKELIEDDPDAYYDFHNNLKYPELADNSTFKKLE